MQNKKPNGLIRNGIMAGLIALLMIFLIGLSFGLLYNQKINDGSIQVTSDQILTCYWTITSDTAANVTWYRNGISNITQNNISCTANVPCSTSADGNVPASYTIRNDAWLCVVSYYNSTDIETKNVSISIINSPPTPPKVLWQNGTDTTNLTAFIPEDNTTMFNVSSTDADNDGITYTLNDTTFCTINSNLGNLTCNPTQESQLGIRALHIGAMDSSSAQFIDFIINVTPTNDPPYFSPVLSNRYLMEGDALNYTIYGADVENPPNTPYVFNMSTNSSTIILEVLNQTAVRIRFNDTGGLDKANYNDKGNHTVFVTITDNGTTFGKGPDPRSFTASFIVQVNTTNNPPNISYYVFNNASLTQGGALLIYVNATDRENDTISFYTSDVLYNISLTQNFSIGNSSFASAIINISNMTNAYVIKNNFSIFSSDGKQNSTMKVSLNISNTNDPPVIYDNSTYGINTLGNMNISNLGAYTGVPMIYKINASDLDDSTYDAINTGIRNYTTNDTNFPIGLVTGIINFTPAINGSYTFIVFVTDGAGVRVNKTASIFISTNHNPYFLNNPIILYCNETDTVNWPANCYYNLSRFVNDSDAAVGDFIKDYWTNSTWFGIDSSTGIINFSVPQTNVGNNSVMFNITDNRSASNSTTIYIIVNNTNNPPNITGIPTLTPLGKRFIGNTYIIRVNASDNDLSLPNTYENLTFIMNVSGPSANSSTLFSTLTKITDSIAECTFSPMTSDGTGDYVINFTVKDYYNNMSAIKQLAFFVYNESGPPNIINITPFATPIMVGINTSWRNFTDFPTKSTNLIIDENSTYTLNQTSSANKSSDPNNTLSYYWYYDNSLINNVNSSSLSDYFDFFSSGQHNISFVATDDFGNNNTFKWYFTINNVIRPPVLVYQLDDLTGSDSVNGTTLIQNYLYMRSGQVKYIEPDDDINSNGLIDGNETYSLVFNATPCDTAEFTFPNGPDLRIKPLSNGTCYVNFTAINPLNTSMYIVSNEVIINISGVSNESVIVPVPLPIPSSGGGSNIKTVTVPLPEEVETPKPLQIITPKLVTVYKNATVKIPIVLNNTWNGSLEGLTLRAYTNATNVTLYLDRLYFPKIDQGKIEEVTLLIGNYKSEGHYEIQLIANVTNPKYEEVATIFVNSADMKSEGEQIESKISFARDLLSSNPECQELNELLNQAKVNLANQNYDASSKLVDDVINGCRYLVGNTNNIAEQPRKDFIKSFEWQNIYNQYLIVAGFAILFLIALYYVFRKERPDNEF